MNHWPFIIAAYVLTALCTGALLIQSYVAMRNNEAAPHEVTDES